MLQDAVLPQAVYPDEGRARAARFGGRVSPAEQCGGNRRRWALKGATWKFAPATVANVTRQPCLLDQSAPPTQHCPRFLRPFGHGEPSGSYLSNLGSDGHAVEIRGGSYATLDNLVVGFRPAGDTPSPVMPLAIQRNAWASERVIDTNGNGIREMLLRLQAARSSEDQRLPPQPNSAVLFYRGSAEPAALAAQVTSGVFPSDLPLSGGALGPATPARPFSVAGSQVADADDPLTLKLLAAIQQAVGRKRAFPFTARSPTPISGTPARHKAARHRPAWCARRLCGMRGAGGAASSTTA